MRSTDFYIQRYGTNITENTPDLFYTIYSDQELFAGFKKTCGYISLSDPDSLKKCYPEFGKYGECYYCSLLRDDESKVKTSDISFQQRITTIGDYAASVFYFEMKKPKKNPLLNRLLLNDEFFVKFNALEYMDVDNVVIDRFQLTHKNGDALKNLKFLSLENNDLTMIDVEFRSLKNLSYVKLSQNLLESLPIDLFTPRSLQAIELNELGQLIEINPNSRFSSDLKTLTITNSIFSTLPLTLGTDCRSKLTKLVLNGVPWWGIDSMSVNEVVQYESFKDKFIAYLSKDELSEIYQMYDEDLNGVLSYSEINLMNAHIYRFLPRLRPTQTTKIVRSSYSIFSLLNLNSNIFSPGLVDHRLNHQIPMT